MNKKVALFHLQQAIRNFFLKEGFLDVLTPPVVENPGMEVHIHPFELHSKQNAKNTDLYLHTSPEFHMKELLSEGFEKIFTMSYCFRDEPDSETHRKQFVMLEWYRANCSYMRIAEDVISLYQHSYQYLKQNNIKVIEASDVIKKLTVQEAFLHYINIDILEYLDTYELYNLIERRFSRITLSGSIADYEWDDLFFLLMYNYIEPEFKKHPFILLYEFPAPLKALSTIKKSDERVCERFEVYCNGIEVCNCFNELTNYVEQKERFKADHEMKEIAYGYSTPWPKRFMNSLKRGLPPSAGIALGVERLLMALTGESESFFD